MRSIRLVDFDLPQIEVFEDGRVWDDQLQIWRTPNTCELGRYSIPSPVTGCGIRFRIHQVVGYYFLAPWAQYPIQIPYMDLALIGFPGYFVTAEGKVWSSFRFGYMSPVVSSEGYHSVHLRSGDGKGYTAQISRLVAKCFIPNPENKPEVNHIDCDKSNNSVHNLEWVHAYENMQHALEHGLRKRCVSDEQIHGICMALERGVRMRDIMVEFGVPKHAITGIKEGCHNRISQLYNIPRNRHFSERPYRALA